MAAGLGYIEFATGDILTAASANGYLASQTVMVFASSAARASAITSPQEGMVTYLKDTNAIEYYSGSAYVAVGGSSGALTLLSTTSFSAVSSISLPTDSFTATYDDYLVMLNITTSSTGQYIQARLRSAGTDNTAATYASGYFAVLMGSSTTVNDNGGATQTSFTKFGYAENALPSYSLAYIRSPKASRRTAYSGNLVGYANEQLLLGGTFSNTTSFDSMTFIVSGTITGAVSVYGISK